MFVFFFFEEVEDDDDDDDDVWSMFTPAAEGEDDDDDEEEEEEEEAGATGADSDNFSPETKDVAPGDGLARAFIRLFISRSTFASSFTAQSASCPKSPPAANMKGSLRSKATSNS